MAKRGRRPGEQTIVRTKLAAWRVRRGLTQDELAELAGISRSKLIRLERGVARTDMRVEDMAQLAIALGCEPADLIERDWLRWRHTKVTQDEIPKYWRDDAAPPPQALSAKDASRERSRLLKELPEHARVGGRKIEVAAGAAPTLHRFATDEEIAAILERDPGVAESHRELARRFRRLAELRELGT
jgi:transcriptional regulator with XRE-family HTH domain